LTLTKLLKTHHWNYHSWRGRF